MNLPEYCDSCSLNNGEKLVGGKGNLRADVFLIGEAPGENEQEQLIPFVGKSGKILDSMLQNIGLISERGYKCYITNIVKHRPPKNRDPLWHEIQACQGYILNEIKFVNPKVILTVGKVSSTWWNRGKPFEWLTYYPERKFMPVYHPAYLIYNPHLKKEWEESVSNLLYEKDLL